MKNVFEHLRDMGSEAPLLYIIATGAGAGLQRLVWDIPGISNFFAGAAMPYATAETVELLGFTPDVGPRGKPEYVTDKVAIDLAMTAYMKAWVPGRKAIGLGMTCSVASKVAHKHGDHRIIASVFGEDGCWVLSAVIPKGEGDEQRRVDGELADRLAMDLLAQFLKGDASAGLANDYPGCQISLVSYGPTSDYPRARLFARPLFWADGTREAASALDPSKVVIFAGAFNPPHPGHFGAAEAAVQAIAAKMGQCRKLVYATTATHPIKAALTTAECLQRARMMKGRSFLVSEGDGLYIEKARRFPGAVFAMGADALDRMLDPQWGPVTPMLHEFYSLGTRFMVSRRKDGDRVLDCEGVVRARLGGTVLHTPHGHLFTSVDFQLDLSSTQLRAASANQKV